MRKTAKTKPKRRTRSAPPPKFDDYWQLRMEGATSRLKAAQQIISHSGTRGGLAENLLRDLIREFLPQRWAVGTGFIMSPDGERSNQVDLLVYDQFSASPIYRDGELVILSPGAARVAVEVKSYLNSEEISKSYDNICSVKRADPSVMGLVFGYDGVQATTFGKHVKAWSEGNGPPGRQWWPERVFNMAQNFLVSPDPDFVGSAENQTFVVALGDDPIIRFFLTATLTKLGLDNLRPFMRADKTVRELLQL